MKFFAIILVMLTIGLPVALVGAAFLAVDRLPLLTRSTEIKPENIARAKRIIERNDPRRMRPGVLRSILIGNEDLDLAANYLVNRYARGSASVVLQDGGASVRASFTLPANPVGGFVNIDAALTETAGLPRIESLRIGRLPVPGFIADYLMRQALENAQSETAVGAAADAIKRVSMRGGTLLVEYEWSERLPEAIRGVLVSSEDEVRLKAYQTRIAQMSTTGGKAGLPMDEVLRALMRLAAERGGDAAAENRAAIIALAFFVNGKGLAAVIPAARDWPKPVARNVTLAGRHDFAQHYSISAAIAASAGSPLSDAVGLYKEVDDSQGGSGFSFNDIAADRAGVRFGELATMNPGGAQKVQRAAAGRFSATDLLPEVKDLPEFMQDAEFKRRYGGIGGAEYKKTMAEIDRRIAALTLFR
ncbi:MAG: hypothetical protein JNM42_08140 [Propionivibrio sp.]|nr:hypothetical protein [Propionivibrio sp.]